MNVTKFPRICLFCKVPARIRSSNKTSPSRLFAMKKIDLWRKSAVYGLILSYPPWICLTILSLLHRTAYKLPIYWLYAGYKLPLYLIRFRSSMKSRSSASGSSRSRTPGFQQELSPEALLPAIPRVELLNSKDKTKLAKIFIPASFCFTLLCFSSLPLLLSLQIFDQFSPKSRVSVLARSRQPSCFHGLVPRGLPR